MTQSKNSEFEMVFIYYNNPKMLEFQIAVWNTYPDHMEKLPSITLVDDGSNGISAESVVRQNSCRLNMKLFQIEVDIPWNAAGARNLGCIESKDWIYMSDIDTILEAEPVRKHFFERTLDTECFYMTRRAIYGTEQEVKPHSSNMLIHKSAFLEVGGYEEDYSGFYGKEDGDFWRRLMHRYKKVMCPDITAKVVNSRIVSDAVNRDLSRNVERNNLIFEHRSKMHFPKPNRFLRFPWRRVF